MTRPLRRRPPTARFLLLALVLALTVLGGTGGAAEGQEADASPELRLVAQTSWVGPDGVFQVSFTGDGIPGGATVEAKLHRNLQSRAALDTALTGGSLGRVAFTVRERPVAELTSPDGVITVSLPVSTGPSSTIDGVQLTNPGVYPFTITVYDADRQPIGTLTTTMLRLGSAGRTPVRRLAVGVVIPVQAPVSLALDGTPVLDDAGAEALTATIEAVASQTDLPLTVAPSAESLELLVARDGDSADLVATLQQRVARQVLATPYAPIDTGAWVGADLSPELVSQWLAGMGAVEGQLGQLPDRFTTTLDRTVTPAALGLLKDGVGVQYVTVPSDQLDPLSSPATTSAFAEQFDLPAGDSGTVRAVVADEPTSRRLVTGDDPVLAAHNALAELALLQVLQTADGPGVAVTVPPDTDPGTLSTFLAGLAAPDGASAGTPGEEILSPVTLTDLFAATAVAESTRAGGNETLLRGYRADPPAGLGRYPSDLRSSRDMLDGLTSLVPAPPSEPSLAAAPTVATLSSGNRGLTAEQRTAVLESADRAVGAVAAEIVVAPEQVVTLTSSSGKVPLNLENRLQQEAHVRIVLSSAKLEFPEGSVIEQVLEPAQTKTIELPVETRASGAFPLTVTITSADGSLPVATTKYTVRSTAISGVGLVLSIGAGLFLLVWWGRHFRTTRRARKLVASNHPALSGSEPDGYAPPDSDPMEGR